MAFHIGARQNSRVTVVSLTPSVNLTPMGSSTPPVPYPVQESFSPSGSTSSNVNFNGDPAYHAGSDTSKVTGDAAGSSGGVKSGTVGAKSTSIPDQSGSTTVRINGQRSIREGDVKYMQNENTIGKVKVEPPTVRPTITDEGKVPAGEWEKFWDAFNEYVPVQEAYNRVSNPEWWKHLPEDLMKYGEELVEEISASIKLRIDTAKEVYNMVDEHIKAMQEDGVFDDPETAVTVAWGDLKTVISEVRAEQEAILKQELEAALDMDMSIEGAERKADELWIKAKTEVDSTTDKFSRGEYGAMAGAAVGQTVTVLWDIVEPRKKLKLGATALAIRLKQQVDGMLKGMKKALAKLREERKRKKSKGNDKNSGLQVQGDCARNRRKRKK